MKQGLFLLCLVFSFMSIGQTSQESKNEMNRSKSNSSICLQSSLSIEQISNEQEVKVTTINRPKVSEKKRNTTSKNEKLEN